MILWFYFTLAYMPRIAASTSMSVVVQTYPTFTLWIYSALAEVAINENYSFYLLKFCSVVLNLKNLPWEDAYGSV